MSDPVRLPTNALRQHAATVDEVSSALALARSAIHETTMDSGAYGRLCQFLPALLGPLFSAGFDAVTQGVDALGDTAAKLRTTASTADQADARAAGRVGQAGAPHRITRDLPL